MKRTALVLATLLVAGAAQAHQVHVESDYAYAPITKPEEAKIIIGHLAEGEVDIYDVLVLPGTLMVANVLPPACKQYKKFHPSVALIGPGLPPPGEVLPFDVPQGMGVIVAHNPKDNSVERPIYTETPDAFNAEIAEANANGCSIVGQMTANLSWFLPYGLTQDCLHCKPWTCDYSNSLAMPVFIPGIYQIVVFDPTGRPGDYSLNLGTGEGENTCDEMQHTIDIIEGIIDGTVYQKNNCVSAGESGWECCDFNYDGVCDN